MISRSKCRPANSSFVPFSSPIYWSSMPQSTTLTGSSMLFAPEPFQRGSFYILLALKRNKPCSTSAMPAKSRPGGNMSFSPLGLTPLLDVLDMPSALAFYRDVLGFAVVSASPEVETSEGRVLATPAVDFRHLPSEISLD